MLTQMCRLSCKDVRRHALQPTDGTAILPHVSSSCRRVSTTPTASDISLSRLPSTDLRQRRSTKLACSWPYAKCHKARPSIFDDGDPSSDTVTSIASPHPVLFASEKPQWYKQYTRLCQNRRRTAKYVWCAVIHHLDLGGTRPDRSNLRSGRTQRLDSTKPSRPYRKYPRQDVLKQEKERNDDRCIQQELCNKNWMVLSRLDTACVL